ncbi:aminotransferase class I/II-fold pyridoxal phosphate-dependent enzyme [Acidobacteria bacterium ACD]|nr:MAG: aminotransferase class I/II-fold pyridoxal phosphate-dependent enzyme [Acidobacteriota bacterium]MCE7958811.1 aminotransferase class I/II-fold pyridoxal phosphate-dependent enzyme [Acidobacteria bacterium ACB2]MDL1950701.1 aminotransferase class I/II-fold pyridoxal phosphate-dependent enzyme [Acidobacteria bacterium ACD]
MSTTLEPTQTLLGAARWGWWDWWIDRKTRWVRDPVPQMDAGLFRALAAGTGLPAIHQKSTFAFHSVREGADRFLGMSKGGERPYARIYTRLGNPTTEYLERVLFRLEAQHVIDKALAVDEKEPTIGSLIFSSGMGSISTLLMSVLRSGDTVLAGNVYGCTDSLLRGLEKFGVNAVFCDMGSVAEVEAALEAHPATSLVFLETPENPTLRLADVEAISRLTEARGVLLAVDNTFCSPYLQQPFRLGADFVVHSLTKFINGHSTSVGGALLGPFRFMKADFFPWYKDVGASPSPFESWLNSCNVQSLAVRQEQECETAGRIALHLKTHPEVEKVTYPGLPDFPQKELAERQMRRGGSLLTFEVAGGVAAGETVMNYFARKDTPMELAVSLGSTITYIQHPASMTHAVVPEADRLARGITPGLIRLSVGLEGAEILIEHLDRALALT